MTGDNTQPPGQARASGPTVADTLAGDRFAPPPPLLESRYEFLGDEDIAFGRYTSAEFFQREMSDLWPRAWQWACREEHVPDVGDTYVYDIGQYSVIVVRSAADTIRLTPFREYSLSFAAFFWPSFSASMTLLRR